MNKEVYLPKGIIPVVPTPFKSDEKNEINWDVYGELIDYVIENGVHAIVIGGTTGEYSTMTYDERRQLMEFGIKRINGRVHAIAGSYAHGSMKYTRELTAYANKLGYEGVLVTSPYYCPPDEKGMYQFYKTLADENPELGILVYNVPACTNVPLSVELMAKLAKIPNIVSTKDTTDLIHSSKLINATKDERFTVLTGEEHLILGDLAIGGGGGIGIISAMCPKPMVNIYNLMEANDVKAAAEINAKMMTLYSLTEDEPNPAPVKAALNILGFDFGDPRLPVLPASDEMYAKLRKELKAVGYDVK